MATPESDQGTHLPSRPPAEVETRFAKAASWLLAFVIALTLNGYPLAGSFASLFELESSLVTYPYRAFVAALTLMLAGMVLARGRFTLDPVISCFFLAYGIRLYYDMTYTSLPDTDRAIMIFISTIILPFLAVSISRYYYVNTRTLIAFVVVSAPSIAVLSFIRGAAAEAMEQNARFGFDALNAVSVSYTGVYCLVAIFFLWPQVRAPLRYLLLAPPALASAYFMVIANARGSILGLALCIAAISIRRGTTLVAVGITTVVIGVLFGDAIANLNVFQRFAMTGTDMSSLERIDRMISSLNLMIENPLLGFGYIENRYYSFPHNLLLEAGLALGFGGVAVMLFLQVRYGLLIWAALRGNGQFVAMLGIIGLSSAWLSSTLWSAMIFWTPMTLLVSLAAEQRSRQARTLPRKSVASPSRQVPRPSVNLPGLRG